MFLGCASKKLQGLGKLFDGAEDVLYALELAGIGEVEHIVVEAGTAVAVNKKRRDFFVGKGRVIAVVRWSAGFDICFYTGLL
jgi:hypothetical protein